MPFPACIEVLFLVGVLRRVVTQVEGEGERLFLRRCWNRGVVDMFVCSVQLCNTTTYWLLKLLCSII